MEAWMIDHSHHLIKEYINKLNDKNDCIFSDEKKSFIEKITSFFHTHFFLSSKIAADFSLYFDALEIDPVRFDGGQSVDFAKVILAAEKLLAQLPFYEEKNKSSLQRKLTALKYRIEKMNGGTDKLKNCDETLFSALYQTASKWKEKQGIFKDKALSSEDIDVLREAACFEEFARLVNENTSLANSFFLYALRDKCPVDVFVQFPATVGKLSHTNLLGRVGRIGKELLKIEIERTKQGSLQKILTLPFEGVPASILDGKKTITFKGRYALSIDEIFAFFENKNRAVGNLEFMAEGIINWNVHKLGWWNAEKQEYEVVALFKKDWWKSLPLFEVITKKAAQERYGKHLDGHSWNAAATSTRGTPTMDYDRSHSYLELAVPCKDHEHYAIYDFGKFALKFPASFFEGVQMFCHTLAATVAYPDENAFYSHRQHAQHSFVLKAKEGAKLFEAIRLDLIKARAGNFVYQIETENCAKWLYEKLEGIYGDFYNLFKMPLLDTTPFGIVYIIFSTICWLPKSVQVRVLTACHIPLGALHSIFIFEDHQWKLHSMSTHVFFKTGEVYLPAFLHSQLESGSLEKVSQLHISRKKPLIISRFLRLSSKFKSSLPSCGQLSKGAIFNVFKNLWMSLGLFLGE